MSYTNYNMDTANNGGERTKILLSPSTRMDSLFTPTADQKHALGRILEADDGTGRMWRYCKNGATALVQSFMCSAEAPSANGLEIVSTGYTMSVGDMSFNMLLTTGNNYSDHELVDGWLYVNKVATILGDQYLIKDNYWTTSDTVMHIELADENGIRHAIAATHELSVVKSEYRDVVVTPTTQAAIDVGVPNVAVAANYFFWAQYRGPCTMISEDTVVIGAPVGKPATHNTAGTCGPMGADTDTIYGIAMTAGADDEPSLIKLMLP